MEEEAQPWGALIGKIGRREMGLKRWPRQTTHSHAHTHTYSDAESDLETLEVPITPSSSG